jgi:hypothetical protein
VICLGLMWQWHAQQAISLAHNVTCNVTCSVAVTTPCDLFNADVAVHAVHPIVKNTM